MRCVYIFNNETMRLSQSNFIDMYVNLYLKTYTFIPDEQASGEKGKEKLPKTT